MKFFIFDLCFFFMGFELFSKRDFKGYAVPQHQETDYNNNGSE